MSNLALLEVYLKALERKQDQILRHLTNQLGPEPALPPAEPPVGTVILWVDPTAPPDGEVWLRVAKGDPVGFHWRPSGEFYDYVTLPWSDIEQNWGLITVLFDPRWLT